MKIATWNINSVRARETRLVRFLEREQPDALCLQELKATDEQFPQEAIEDAGYHAAVHGQKTYNGVAIVSREKPANIIRGLGDDVDDPQARLVSAEIGGVRIISAYFPNGRTVGSAEYSYKIEWMGLLREHLDENFSADDAVVLAGDFNVAPFDTDAKNPDRWRDSVLMHDAARDALRRIAEWGFGDVVRARHPEGGLYSWWDYRMLGFPKNDGLRIDHIYATESLASRCVAASVDRNERKKGDVEKPSDHAPVIAEFD